MNTDAQFVLVNLASQLNELRMSFEKTKPLAETSPAYIMQDGIIQGLDLALQSIYRYKAAVEVETAKAKTLNSLAEMKVQTTPNTPEYRMVSEVVNPLFVDVFRKHLKPLSDIPDELKDEFGKWLRGILPVFTYFSGVSMDTLVEMNIRWGASFITEITKDMPEKNRATLLNRMENRNVN